MICDKCHKLVLTTDNIGDGSGAGYIISPQMFYDGMRAAHSRCDGRVLDEFTYICYASVAPWEYSTLDIS